MQNYTLNDLEQDLEHWFNSSQIAPNGEVMIIKRFVTSVGGFKIILHSNDHNPRHFHAISIQRGIDAKFDLNNIDYISESGGSIQESDIKKIKAYFKFHPKSLEFLKSESYRLSP